MYYVKVDSVAACLLTLFFFFSTLSCPAATSANGPTPPKPKPNIFLVLADDLDERLGSVPLALNNTLKYFSKHGTIFENAFVTTPVCCPSRSSMLSGLYAHNHGALTNNDECNGEFWKKNIEHKTIGVRMQQAGYQTGESEVLISIMPIWCEFLNACACICAVRTVSFCIPVKYVVFTSLRVDIYQVYTTAMGLVL